LQASFASVGGQLSATATIEADVCSLYKLVSIKIVKQKCFALFLIKLIAASDQSINKIYKYEIEKDINCR